LKQNNMYKNKITNHYIEFAARWKQVFSPESVAQGRETARSTAIDKKGVSKGIFPMKQAYTDLESRVNKGTELSNKGRQAMAAKAASSNRTMRPTKQRGLLKAAPTKNQLSSKSANSFKQGAQNQATNKANAVTRRLQDATDKATGQGKYKTPLTTPTLNPFEQSSWEKNANNGSKMKPIDVSGRLNSVPVKKTSLLGKVGRAIKRNPVAAGAGLGAIGAGIGYGAYKKLKKDKNR
jgi:hypothetical protein